jgi:hypothetical protein
MTKLKLDSATVDELVERFVDLCIAQDRELLRGDIARVNALSDDIEAIKQELKTLPGDKRRALIPLYRHENMQVRLKAAKATLAVEPEAARKALQDVEASNVLPQSADAGMSLWNLDRGVFKPT